MENQHYLDEIFHIESKSLESINTLERTLARSSEDKKKIEELYVDATNALKRSTEGERQRLNDIDELSIRYKRVLFLFEAISCLIITFS